ncbi:DUF4402 domain-containing protein [Parasphingopyxis algicola]|uniref:DUF4402 domain-containing protein n=1 Tax=Parasphingopyxis algicola TaxID=2026624 RepID=UPI0015A27A21|nr:DUF4402 domain-containing protein [Parasphingopyxis algicola]QLC25620.1 DUF4402 domain-containing protein [Parasphingopyxis algicola]
MARLDLFLPVLLAGTLPLAAPSAVAAQAACRLCDDEAPIVARARPARPLQIDIDTGIDFDRMALIDYQGGAAEIDPLTGQRRLTRLLDLGGVAMRGTVTIRGEPGRAVRIDLPDQVVMRAPGGRRVELRDMRSDLPAQPRIGSDGVLRFSFGGRIDVDGEDFGRFRGRIRVSAEYE